MRILLLILIGLVLAGCLAVETNEIAVIQDRLTGEYLEPLQPGQYRRSQHWDVTIYSTDSQYLTFATTDDADLEPVQALSSDGQQLWVSLSVIFRVDTGRVTTLHQRWGDEYVNPMIVPLVRSVVREVVRTVQATDSYKQGRDTIQRDVLTLLQARLASEGIEVNDVVLRDIRFTEEFARSIELTAIAERTATAESQGVVQTVTPSP